MKSLKCCNDLDEISEIVEEIIKRGNDAEIRRKGNGYIILEVKKTIKFASPLM